MKLLPPRRLICAIALCAVAGSGCAVAVSGCAGGSARSAVPATPARAALGRYLQQIEPLRLAVNRLLEGADPILNAYHEHDISGAQAARRMGVLEREFADYAVDVAAIHPSGAALASLHAEYAHTYVLEDSYLSALVTGLAEHELDRLPDTQSEQRAAIIEWRIGLTVLARQTDVTLPADLQQAGRGEIAPSVGGS